MHLTPKSFVVNLLKMLTYVPCMLRFFVGSRLALKNTNNLLKSGVRSRNAGGVIYYF